MLDIETQTSSLGNVTHIERQHQGHIHFNKLGRQIQVTLNAGCIHHIDHDIREKGEIQLTSAQEYMRTQLLAPGGYGACTIEGHRYDTGIPYGLMESQIALALAGTHRADIIEAMARLLLEELRSVARR